MGFFSSGILKKNPAPFLKGPQTIFQDYRFEFAFSCLLPREENLSVYTTARFCVGICYFIMPYVTASLSLWHCSMYGTAQCMGLLNVWHCSMYGTAQCMALRKGMLRRLITIFWDACAYARGPIKSMNISRLHVPWIFAHLSCTVHQR